MDIFRIILSPFLYLIEQLFLLSYSITNNYGVSIVLLSFAVSVLLLPIFILIEKAKKKDDAIKRKMKPLVDEIKRCYKGQERYYYLKTLNRQHNYSPIRALIPTLSLVLQIPFFIAAYRYLSHFEPLTGVRFAFINDLSQPDAVLGNINVLPILMTVVNLVTAWFYTRNGNANERKQMVAVAAIFLILLFKLPSGLVLYWTMNNVFSFLRLFITNREVFIFSNLKNGVNSKRTKEFINILYQKQGLFIKLAVICAVILVILQINWVIKYDDNSILYLRILLAIIIGPILGFISGLLYLILKRYKHAVVVENIKPVLFFSVLFSACYFYWSGKYYFQETNHVLFNYSSFLIFPFQIICFIFIVNTIKQGNLNLFFKITGFVLIFILITQFIQLATVIFNNSINFTILGVSINAEVSKLEGIVKNSILFCVFSVVFYFKNCKPKFNSKLSSNWITYSLAIVYLLGFVLIANPLLTFYTFPEVFDFTDTDIINNNIIYFVILLFIFVLVYFLLPRWGKQLWLFSVLTVVILSIIHSTILPIEVGKLQENRFHLEQNIAVHPIWYFIELVFLLTIFFSLNFFIHRGFSKQISIVLLLLNIGMVVQIIHKKNNQSLSSINESTELSTRFHFSKNEKNVLLIIPDMFQGISIDRMLKEEPKIKKVLDGFVYYPNTLAISVVTNTSIAPLIAGHEYTPDILDLDTIHTIPEKITQIARKLVEEVNDSGFSFYCNRIPYAHISNDSLVNFLPRWHEEWDKHTIRFNVGANKETGYTMLIGNALFFSSPLAFKPRIYNQGDWLEKNDSLKKGLKTVRNTLTTQPYNFLRILPYISNSNSKKPNYNIIYSLVTHAPFNIINEDNTFKRDVHPYETNKWFMETMINWFTWMKKNGVYDNTKIIIVSDHGMDWGFWKGDKELDTAVFKNISKEIISLDKMMGLNPVLLVKDYYAKGSISKDFRFMSNMDVHNISLDKSDPTKGEAEKNRTLPAYVTWWSNDLGKRKTFLINKTYEVKDNIFDGNNWVLKGNKKTK